MSTNQKNLRKDLKAPDKFQVSVAKGFTWTREHSVVVAGIAGALVAIFGGWALWKNYQDSQTIERQAALAVIDVEFDKETEAAEKSREVFRRELELLSLAADPAAKEKSPAADTSKRDALETKIRSIKADHSATASKYADFAAKHAGTPEGWVASMRAASVKITGRQWDEAATLLKSVLDQSSGHEFFQTHARASYVAVLEEQGKLTEALAEAEQLLKISNEQTKPAALLLQGRLQLANKQLDQAKKTLDELIEKHGSTQEADKARTMRAIMPMLATSSS